MDVNNDLFGDSGPEEEGTGGAIYEPLASRLRPRSLEDYVGQEHLLGKNGALRKAIQSGQLHSMILWGPPGTGKTTLARLVAHYANAEFITLSAVLSGVKDIRAAVDRARAARQAGRSCILFVDEVHRFNKAQQDAFLPHVEDGTFIFIGATTENPSFELNNALLSRARVYVLKSLTEDAIEQVLNRALASDEGLGKPSPRIEPSLLQHIAQAADGDARRALSILEVAYELALSDQPESPVIDEAILQLALGDGVRRFDKGGDYFYDQISALHKSVRGSSPDAALYWFARMLDGGCDPLYIARRVVRMASEDIGNADPRGLTLALNAWDVQTRLGSPEGELAIAQAIVYLAVAPKSNAVYRAYNQARAYVKSNPSHEVPEHLRNAPTQLAKDMGHGREYRYAHDEPDAFAAGESYFPPEVEGTCFYHPVDRGLEIRIREKLQHLKELNRKSPNKRYGDQ